MHAGGVASDSGADPAARRLYRRAAGFGLPLCPIHIRPLPVPDGWQDVQVRAVSEERLRYLRRIWEGRVTNYTPEEEYEAVAMFSAPDVPPEVWDGEPRKTHHQVIRERGAGAGR